MNDCRDAKRPAAQLALGIRDEEFLNFLTHGAGLLLALAGSGILFSVAAGISSELMRLSCRVYGLTLVAMYAASMLSHLFENPARRHFFRSLDQGVIFLFMAANFTPMAIAHLPAIVARPLLVTMWSLALIGFYAKIIWRHRVESIAITHYLALAWLPITVIGPLLNSIPTSGALWFVGGGIVYMAGTIFLTLDTRVRYFHAIWHLSVIAGSFCHFLVIVDYAIPMIT